MSIVNTCKIPDLSGTNTVNTTPLTSTTSLSSSTTTTTTSINYHLPAIINPSATQTPACNINISNNNSNCSNSNNNSLPVSTSTNNSTVVNSHQSSKQIYNGTTLKLLNRLLEEASQTGDLNLNNKNLHEFPSRLAVNYDLSDTITAGLFIFIIKSQLFIFNTNKIYY